MCVERREDGKEDGMVYRKEDGMVYRKEDGMVYRKEGGRYGV